MIVLKDKFMLTLSACSAGVVWLTGGALAIKLKEIVNINDVFTGSSLNNAPNLK